MSCTQQARPIRLNTERVKKPRNWLQAGMVWSELRLVRRNEPRVVPPQPSLLSSWTPVR